MSKMADLKTKIKELVLDPLVTAGKLKEVQVDDFKMPLLQRSVAHYPAAILTSPEVTASTVSTFQTNQRVYTFQIVVLQKLENIAQAGDLEDLIEALMDQIDKNYTLGGQADGAVEPSTSQPEPIVSQGHQLVAFAVQIRAKADTNIT